MILKWSSYLSLKEWIHPFIARKLRGVVQDHKLIQGQKYYNITFSYQPSFFELFILLSNIKRHKFIFYFGTLPDFCHSAGQIWIKPRLCLDMSFTSKSATPPFANQIWETDAHILVIDIKLLFKSDKAAITYYKSSVLFFSYWNDEYCILDRKLH